MHTRHGCSFGHTQAGMAAHLNLSIMQASFINILQPFDKLRLHVFGNINFDSPIFKNILYKSKLEEMNMFQTYIMLHLLVNIVF